MQFDILEADNNRALSLKQRTRNEDTPGATSPQERPRTRSIRDQRLSSCSPRPCDSFRQFMETKHHEFRHDRPPNEVLNYDKIKDTPLEAAAASPRLLLFSWTRTFRPEPYRPAWKKSYIPIQLQE